MKKLSFPVNGLKACLLTLFLLHPVWADDTEIFFTSLSGSDTQSNILFVLDASDSMGRYDCKDGSSKHSSCNDGTPNGTASRLDRMIDAMSEVLDAANDVNVGLMRFGGFDGGRVLFPVTDINGAICKDQVCGDDFIFQVRSEVHSSDDDAFEDTSGAVHTTEVYLPLMDSSSGELHSSVMRFPNLEIPQGATIEDARIVFTSVSANSADSKLKFQIEDTADAAQFVDGSSGTISARSWSSDEVAWEPEPWIKENIYESPDLSSLVKQVVNRPDWCGGNAVALQVAGSGDRLASSFENDLGGSVLKVSFRLEGIPQTGGCIKDILNLKVNRTNADAYEQSWNGVVNDTKGNVRVRNNHMAGFQFYDVPLEQGTKIVSARMGVTSAWTSSNFGDITTRISFEDDANPDPFNTNVYNLSSRSRAAGVDWDMPIVQEKLRYYSPDIGQNLEDILGKPDWVEGNKLSVFFTHQSGSHNDSRRTFYSFDSWDPSNSAELEVTYQASIRTAAELVTDVRSRLKDEMAEMRLVLGTPTVGALEEAMRYMTGMPVMHGKKRAITTNPKDPSESRVSTPSSYTGGRVVRDPDCYDSNLNSVNCASEGILGNPIYQSPMKQECQSNHVVVLTDGAPWQEEWQDHTDMIGRIEAINGGPCDNPSSKHGLCGEELASYMYNTDFDPVMPKNQNITTHTIGFNIKNDWIKHIADAGGGGYYTAESAADLVLALTTIVSTISDSSTTFVAPAATVDQYSRISHREDVYLALFKPGPTGSWSGNLKRYSLNGDSQIGLHDDSDPPVPAIDPATGQFLDTSRSFWLPSTDTADGGDIEAGGAARHLNPNSRKIVTYLGAADDLFSNNNRIAIDNDSLTMAHFGAADANERAKYIDWLAGFDVRDENEDGSTADYRNHMGDPLHSSPVLITYADATTTNADEPESVVYVGTNEGFVHAFDTQDGTEDFAFMPAELLSNVPVLFQENSILYGRSNKPYGMDGDLTLWTSDANKNGLIETGDVAHLIAGMRRGGKNYYALNVSDRDNPEFEWSIIGGSGDFSELGQSWSKPFAGRIKVGTTVEDVLVFAGGYDPAQDDKTVRSADSIGRAIFVVDAYTGNLIWSGGLENATKTFSDMKYSIPSDLKIVKEGELITQMYVGDMGGQIWRFDINNGESGSDLIDGGVIADFGADNDAKAARRFYHAPDLSLSRAGSKRILNVAIGSGYRAHPLDVVIEDKYFVFQYPYDGREGYGMKGTGDTSYRPIKLSDLFDTTDNAIGEGKEKEVADAKKELASKQGWYISMELSGEKILGSGSTLNNVVKFISYAPSVISEGCAANVGVSYYWAVNLLDGTPYDPNAGYEDGTDDGTGTGSGSGSGLTKADRKRQVQSEGLSPAVSTVFVATANNEVTPVDMCGTNVCQEWDNINTQKRWFWSEYPE